MRTILFANATMATWRCRRVSTWRNHWPSDNWSRFRCTNEDWAPWTKSSRRYVFPRLLTHRSNAGAARVQPRGHVATPRAHAPVTDGGDDGRGDHRTDAGDSGRATTERRLIYVASFAWEALYLRNPQLRAVPTGR